DVGMAEVSLIPDSGLLGKTLQEASFRSRYGLTVVGIRRDGEALEGTLADEALKLGDILLVIGDWKNIRLLHQHKHHFIVLNLPAEVDEVAPASNQAPHALFCLALMVAMMLTDEIPNAIAALIACLLMGQFRCIDMESAYRAMHWPSLILIV
ncbi:SLC13 family permease, partial [Pectobacterium versatile]|nr:SLC13 family permease [Pectobacterium versatile]